MLKTILLLSLAILCSVRTEVVTTEPKEYTTMHGPRILPVYAHPPPIYEINLDLDYEERWRKVMTELGRPNIIKLFNWFIKQAKIPDEVVQSIDYEILEAYDREFAMEIAAIAKLLGLSFQHVALLNVFFDATTMCTGIIVQDANNNIFHARNLDFVEAELMTKMIFQGNYIKDGKLLYQSINKVGQIGLLTGIKKDKFTINLNQNVDPFAGDTFYWNNIQHVILSIYDEMRNHYITMKNDKSTYLKPLTPDLKYSPLLVARRAMEKCNSYEEIIDFLKDTPTFSRVFYIVAGTKSGEGMIMTKKGSTVEHVDTLDPENGVWFLIVTNYAHNVADPDFDNRATMGRDEVNEITRAKLTKENLFSEVMAKNLIFNSGTIHTTMMQASANYFNTTVWGFGPFHSDHNDINVKKSL